jgi:hypothetical protein
MQQGNGNDKKIGAKFTMTIMSREHNHNKMDCNELIQNEEKPLTWTIYVTMNLPKL